MVGKKLKDIFSQMDDQERTRLESKTEDDNLVKLPFNSPLGNPIYLPKDSEVMSLVEKINRLNKDLPPLSALSTYEIKIREYFSKPYSADCITEFSKILSKEMFNEGIGELSVMGLMNFLIQKSTDQEHLIDTTSNSFEFDSFGYTNTKNITIEGNLGDYTGYTMKAGKIVVKGDVGFGCGYNMTGGTIHIEGNLESISPFISVGNVYHKDKQIVKKGEILDKEYLENLK